MVIKHIRNAVLRSAEVEAHHAKEDGGVLCDLMLIILKAVHGDKDKDVAENAQKEEAQDTVFLLDLADGSCLFRKAPGSGEPQDQGDASRTDQVAGLDDGKGQGVGCVVPEGVADLSGEKMIAPGADDEEAGGEEGGSDHLIVHGQEKHSAKADAEAGQNG